MILETNALSNSECPENVLISKRCCFGGCLFDFCMRLHLISMQTVNIIWHKIEAHMAYGSVQGEGLLITMSISFCIITTALINWWWWWIVGNLRIFFRAALTGSGVGYQRAWDPGWVWVYVSVHAFVAVFRGLLVISNCCVLLVCCIDFL